MLRVETVVSGAMVLSIIGGLWWTYLWGLTPVLVISLAALGWVLTALSLTFSSDVGDGKGPARPPRWLSPVMVLGAALMTGVAWTAMLSTAQSIGSGAGLLAAVLGISAVLCVLLVRVLPQPELCAATRVLGWCLALLLLQLGTEHLWPALLTELVGRGLWPILGSLMLFWALELVHHGWRLRSAVYTPQSKLLLLFRRWNPVAACLDALQELFGIDLAGTWVITFLRRSIEPMVVTAAALCWLLSGLTIIQPYEVGIRETAGKLSVDSAGPGLVLHWPWPLGRVHRVDVGRIQEISIGHAEEDSAPSKTGWSRFLPQLIELSPNEEMEETESLLWANQHSDEEFSLLLGDGRDLIAADGVLNYRISDPHRYLSSTQNPEHLLEALAYRVLMHETARRTLEQALSENLNQLAREVTQALQRDVAAANIGLEPTGFYFSALHPPVAVAKDYQAVISAQIEERTKVIRAETHRRRSLPRALSDAVVARSEAEAEASIRRAESVGEAAAFESLSSSVRSDEELYVFRRQAEALEQNLTGRDLVIVDHRIERDGGELWIKK